MVFRNKKTKTKNPKVNIQLIILFIIVIVMWLFAYFYLKHLESKKQGLLIKEFKDQVIISNKNINNFMVDSSNFLYYTKKYFETKLMNSKLNPEMLKDFNKKYRQTNKNLISNYKFVLENRKDRKKISATFLNKNRILKDDVKYISLLTEVLDQYWQKFIKKYPFVTLTYVDKNGFYREFPFRKISPKGSGYLSDPRNYPYYSVATTIAKDEVFLTKPYQNNKGICVSLVIPVYLKENFKGLLTVDVAMKNFSNIAQKGGLSHVNNFIIFNKKGNLYVFSIEDSDSNNIININNLNDILKNQKELLAKNITVYPLISDKYIINYIDTYLKNPNSSQRRLKIGIWHNNFLALSRIDNFNLIMLNFSTENNFSGLNIIEKIKKVIIIIVIIFTVLFSLFYILSNKKSVSECVTDSLILNLIDNKPLIEILGSSNKAQEKTEEKITANTLKNYVRELQKEINFFRTSCNNINLGILILNKEGKTVFVNKWFNQLILDIKEIDLMPDDLKEEIKEFRTNNSHQIQKTIKIFDAHYLFTGEKIYIRFLKTNEEYEKEMFLLFTLSNFEELIKKNKEVKNLQERINLLEKKIRHFEKSFENLNTKIIQSDKFAVFGELIQGIVHNINNPLMIVTSRLSMVKTIVENLDDSMDKRRLLKHITNIISSLRKINEIIDSVLIKAKMTVEKEEKLLNVNDIIKSELEFFNADLFFKHKVQTIVKFKSNLPDVRISQSDFSQVLHNLIKNALDALKSSAEPKLYIRTYSGERYVFVEIKDNGPGVPDKYKEKIFEQYFTTKGSRGTGIGLYNARKIIEEYNGELNLVDSTIGAKFVIKLPFISEE